MSEKLEKYRKEIAELDIQILKLISTRFHIAEKIGEIKRQQNLPITNRKVEAEVISRAVAFAKETSLDEDFAVKLVTMLIAEATKVQENAGKVNK